MSFNIDTNFKQRYRGKKERKGLSYFNVIAKTSSIESFICRDVETVEECFEIGSRNSNFLGLWPNTVPILSQRPQRENVLVVCIMDHQVPQGRSGDFLVTGKTKIV